MIDIKNYTIKEYFENYLSIATSANPVLIVGRIDRTFFENELNINPIDFFVLEGEDLKIEKIRELIKWLSLSPVYSKKRVVLISEVDKLKIEAGNALLKTLEEPPSFAKIFLSTSHEELILPTITSRCQKVRMPISILFNVYAELNIENLSKLAYFERFKLISGFLEDKPQDQEIDNLLTSWQNYYREKLLKDEDVVKILEEISVARDLLRTNISVKLLLENLVISF